MSDYRPQIQPDVNDGAFGPLRGGMEELVELKQADNLLVETETARGEIFSAATIFGIEMKVRTPWRFWMAVTDAGLQVIPGGRGTRRENQNCIHCWRGEVAHHVA